MRNCTNTRLLRKMLIVLLLCSFIAGTFTACSDKKQSDGKTTFTVGFDAESCYQSGDTFFEDEHNAWERLNTELLAQGYSVEEVESLRKKYESKYAQDCKAERAVSKELNLGRSIWKELTVSASAEEKQYDKETIRDRKEQPVR